MPYIPKGSICVVTGAASGIGKSLCYRLAELGATKVVAVDLHFPTLQKALDGIDDDTKLLIDADVASEMNIRRIIRKTETEVGPINAFFCNAGILGGVWGGGPEVSNDKWSRMWEVNVMQAVYVARHLFPLYESRGKGALMITASAAGLLTLAGNLPYSVTKHAAVAVAEWLKISYENIQITCLCPQGVKTNMLAGHDPTAVWGGGGLISPDKVAIMTIDAMCQGRFLVLPHPDVAKFFQFKSKNYDLWLQKMNQIHNKNLDLLRLTSTKTKQQSKL
mmetsp:Transcript_27917/g.41207  ORF Transcript_27917/g.41207 Transcript_27917/m.41207 type:complete len:277 (-) Transcript_27917:62-892(-)